MTIKPHHHHPGSVLEKLIICYCYNCVWSLLHHHASKYESERAKMSPDDQIIPDSDRNGPDVLGAQFLGRLGKN